MFLGDSFLGDSYSGPCQTLDLYIINIIIMTMGRFVLVLEVVVIILESVVSVVIVIVEMKVSEVLYLFSVYKFKTHHSTKLTSYWAMGTKYF